MDNDKIEKIIVEGIKQGQYPRFVYKYRISDSVQNPYFDSIITNNALMFSSPKPFNDPFDCQLQPVTFPMASEVKEFLDKVLPLAPQNLKDNLLINAMANPDKFSKIIEDAINFDEKGVLCLSQEPDNILLWSHYADNHKGVCLEFDILEDLGFFSIPLKVIYEEIYPIYNHMTESNQIVMKLIKTKYDLWKYEKEIRIFKQEKKLYNFNKKALTKIIFGCNTPQVEVDRIKRLADTSGYKHMTYSKAEKQIGVYGLTLQQI